MTTRNAARVGMPIRNTVAAKATRKMTPKATPKLKARLAAIDWRLYFVGGVIAVWAVLVAGRLVQLQVYQAEALREFADKQQQRIIETTPRRGRIVDRNGNELASSIEVQSVYVSPKTIDAPDQYAEPLAKALHMEKDVVLQRLKSTKAFVALKRKIEPDEAAAVQAFAKTLEAKDPKRKATWLQFVNEMKRQYPQNLLGAQLVGFVNSEEQGQAGVERSFEKHLIGRPGRVMVELDARRTPFNTVEQAPEVGQSLILTVDMRIQYQVERILAQAVKSSGAKGGTVVVIQPSTGEILAMASSAGDAVNAPIGDEKEMLDRYRAKGAMDHYEPGSAFKIITYSAALEEKLITPSQRVDCQGGSITVNGHTVLDGGRYGTMTAEEALSVSSNVAAIKLGRQLGRERMLKYVDRFGFGRTTGSGLPGESAGGVGQWSDALLGALPMGYSVNVTPLQLCAATAAVANDGVYIQPRIARRIISSTGDVLLDVTGEKRRILSVQTAQEMRRMLRSVVDKGTGKEARVNGFTTAGKTGTSKKVDRKTGRYSESRYSATFAGFAPVARTPEIAVVVVMDEPPFGRHHGGQAAAPVFREVVETILPMLGIAPDAPALANDAQVARTTIPEEADPFDGPSSEAVAAERRLAESGASTAMASPAAPAPTPVSTASVTTVVSGADSPRMPDLRGQGLRSALQKCAELGIRLDATGFGVVATQSLAPGTPVGPGSVCQVKMSQ